MIIREVYEIEGWEFASKHHRYFFNGHIAPKEIRDKYLYKDISKYIVQQKISKKTGKLINTVNQNLKWVNC